MSSPRVAAVRKKIVSEHLITKQNGSSHPSSRVNSVKSNRTDRVQSPPKNLAPIRNRSASAADLVEAPSHNIYRQSSGSSLNKPILGKTLSASSEEPNLGLHSPNVQVSGRERTKYFLNKEEEEENFTTHNQFIQRSSISADGGISNSTRRSVETIPPRHEYAKYPQSPAFQPNGVKPQMVSVEVQTMYRDSEAQTDPYEPEYILEEGKPKPEVLYLAELGLSYGKGLPVGPEEILKIERARQKRAYEASLPSFMDQESLELRKRKMEEQEELEWSYREEEFRKMQTQRLEMTENALKINEQERELLDNYKIQSIMMRAVAKKENALNKIEKERIQTMRKIEKERENIEGKQHRRDIIEDYADHASRVYAPVTREGRRRDAYVLQDIKPPTLATLGGVETVEQRLHSRMGTRDMTKTLDSMQSTKGSTMTQTVQMTRDQDLSKYREPRKPRSVNERQEKEIRENLDKLEKSFKAAKTMDPNAKLPKPSVAEKIEKPPPRPPTPSVQQPDFTMEEQEAAVLLLQYLIRGRAIQNRMYEGKERRTELISELKASEMYRDVDKPRDTEDEDLQISREKSEKEEDMSNQQSLEEHVDNLALSTLEDAIGSIVGASLDFLSKELVRTRQVKQIEAFVQVAEKTRRMREAEESGRRQIEQQIRINHDEQYRQIMEVHQRTASTYFEFILEDAIIDIRAREEIKRNKTRVEDEARLALLQTSPDDVINDLIFGYLFPFVEQNSSKEQASLEINKHKKAAWSVMDLIVSDIESIET